MIKLSHVVGLFDCTAKRMQCFRGDLDEICGQLQI